MEIPRRKWWQHLAVFQLVLIVCLTLESFLVTHHPKIEREPVKVNIASDGYLWQDNQWLENTKNYDGQTIYLVPYEHSGVVDFRMEKP